MVAQVLVAIPSSNQQSSAVYVALVGICRKLQMTENGCLTAHLRSSPLAAALRIVAKPT